MIHSRERNFSGDRRHIVLQKLSYFPWFFKGHPFSSTGLGRFRLSEEGLYFKGNNLLDLYITGTIKIRIISLKYNG